MTQALTTVDQAARSIATEVFGADRAEIVRDMIAKNCTDAEIAVFAEVCSRTKLDPFARQIYAIKRRVNEGGSWVERMTIQISIDGARLAAERSGKYLGQTPAEWCGQDGVWRDVWLPDGPPAAARIGVWKTGAREPTYAVARYSSYAQTNKEGQPVGQWRSMPDVMIAKCAESLALRKAFPAELSGVYTSEEMQQADAPAVEASARVIEESPAPPSNLKTERDAFLRRAANLGFGTESQILSFIGRAVEKGGIAKFIANGGSYADLTAELEAAVLEAAQRDAAEEPDQLPFDEPQAVGVGR